MMHPKNNTGTVPGGTSTITHRCMPATLGAGGPINRRAVHLATASLFIAVLTACGGGGGDGGSGGNGASSGVPSQPSVSTTLMVSGTAATGFAISGAIVTAKCKTGSGTTITSSDGRYNVSITGGQAPCMLQITNPVDSIKLHTVTPAESNPAIANITPLTDMATARVLGSEPNVFFAAFDAALAAQKLTAATIKAAQADVSAVLADTVSLAAVPDFLAAPLTAATPDAPSAGDVHDKLLDALKLKLDRTQIGTIVTALASNQPTPGIRQAVINMTASAIVPPVAVAGTDQVVVTGTAVTLDASASTVGAGNNLGYTWTLTLKPAGSTALLLAPNTAKPSFVADKAGTYVFSLVVNDGKTDSSAAAVTVTVSNANAAPVANAGAGQSVVANSLVTLDGQGSHDANGDPLTYAWTLTSKPNNSMAVLAGATSARPTFTADVAGVYIASLKVNDGKVDSAPVTVGIMAATANARPVANAGANQEAIVGNQVTLDGTASQDADGDPLMYSWTLTSKPAASTAALTSPSSPRPAFTPDVVGNYVATLEVRDALSYSTPTYVTINVVNPTVSTDFSGNESVSGIVLQSDGKLLIAGDTEKNGFRNIALARYHSNGSLDLGFGAGGKVITDISAVDIGKSVATQIDGKILVAGSTAASNDVASVFVLVRYGIDGKPDAAFGTDGKVLTHVGSSFNESPAGVAQLPDGKIIVGGSSPDGLLLARYLADGSLDASYGVNGKVIKKLSQFVDTTDMLVAADGSVVLVGANRYDNDFVVARFTTSGQPDTAFGATGIVYTRFDQDNNGQAFLGYGRHDSAGAVAIDPSARIVVAGSSEFNMGQGYVGRVALSRYLSDGSLDPSFGIGGKVLTGFPPALNLHVVIHKVIVQPNGKILVAGHSSQKGGSYSFNPVIFRYNMNGTLDTTFGDAGMVIPSLATSTGSRMANGAQLLPNGKIIMAGSDFNGLNRDFALMRYNADGSIDSSFGR